MIGSKPVCLEVRESCHHEDYDRVRVLDYPGTHVHIVCFSVVSPDSFVDVERRWLPSICDHSPGVPVLLVGTKIDLRSDEAVLANLAQKGKAPITHDQGSTLAQHLNETGIPTPLIAGNHRPVFGYCECSAVTQEGLQEVFETAAKLGLEYKNGTAAHPARTRPSRARCIIQ